MSGNYLPEVRNQYEEYPYPPVDPQTEKKMLHVPYTDALYAISHYCYGGKKDLRDNCRFLVAGGGTGDSAIALAEQLRGYKSEIVYLDLSQTSQNIARERARIRGLEGDILWKQGSLLDLPTMGLGEFDYINCSGVLHHLKDPDLGLQALVSVLKPEGVVGIMVYAKYGRTGIYQMQELLRLINHRTPEPAKRVENTKAILNNVPSTSWFLSSPPLMFKELTNGDAAIYDLLLHSQDRAYSIPELYQFVRGAGLDIVMFYPDDPELGKRQYNPLSYIEDEHLKDEVRALPLEQRYQLAELLHGKISRHAFYATRQVQPAADPADLDMVPFLNDAFLPSAYKDMEAMLSSGQEIIRFDAAEREIRVRVINTPHLYLIGRYLDGKRTTRDILQLVINAAPKGTEEYQILQEFWLFFNTLHEHGWLMLRHSSVPLYHNKHFMQKRVPNA